MNTSTLTIDEVNPGGLSRRRWGLASTALGGALWMGVTPLSAWPHGFGSVEHLLSLMPLVGAPLGMLLHARLTEPGSASRAPRLAQLLQPIAAIGVLASFALPRGPAAAALAGLWLAVALVFAVTGSYRSGLNVGAAQVLMPIGGLWLIFTRLGLHPAGLSDERVLLAALHFQYSGFALQLVAAATLKKASHRWIRVGLVAGLAIIAAGNMAAVTPLRMLGAFMMIAATLSLATVLITSFRGVALKIAGLSLFAAMTVSLVYGVSNLAGAPLLDVPQMAMTHGLLNALGFALFGIVGHLREGCPVNGGTCQHK